MKNVKPDSPNAVLLDALSQLKTSHPNPKNSSPDLSPQRPPSHSLYSKGGNGLR